MEYKLYMEREDCIWEISKIMTFSVRVFKAVLRLLANVIYREINFKLLV